MISYLPNKKAYQEAVPKLLFYKAWLVVGGSGAGEEQKCTVAVLLFFLFVFFFSAAPLGSA